MSLAVGLLLGVGILGPATLAHAASGEGVINYTGGDAANPSHIDPFADTGAAHAVSGSKEASDLVGDRTDVTISFPAADYQQDYDIVLVVDATGSFANMAPVAQAFLQQTADNLALRPGASLHIGIVAYGTIAYSSFARPTDFQHSLVFSVFASAVANGTLASTLQSIQPATWNSFSQDQKDLLSAMTGVQMPGWPTGYLATGGTVKTYSYLLGDMTNGLVQLTSPAATGPGSAGALSTTMKRNGSAFAMEELMTSAAYTGNSLATTLGYKMTNPVIGTNLEAGLKAGQALLNTGSAPEANQYLVYLTDAGTYYWNDPTDTPAQSLSGGIYNPGNNTVRWGNVSFDWNVPGFKSRLVSSELPDYAGFLADTTATGHVVGDDVASQISIADWQSFASGGAYDPTGLTQSFNDFGKYPYTSLEKGTAHAAVALQQIVDAKPLEHVIMLGTDYNPQYGTSATSPFMLAQKWRQWATDLIGVQNSFDLGASPTQDNLMAAFDSIARQL